MDFSRLAIDEVIQGKYPAFIVDIDFRVKYFGHLCPSKRWGHEVGFVK